MNSCSSDAEELRREMSQVRSSLDEEMVKFVENTRVLLDWRHYIRSAPWLCMGGAALVGYLVVPSRTRLVRPDASQLAELAKHRELVLTEPGNTKPKSSMLAGLGGAAASFLLRSGMSLATEYLRGVIGQAAVSTDQRQKGAPR